MNKNSLESNVPWRVFEDLFSCGHDVMIINSDYDILEVNDTFLKRLGYEREDVIGKKCYQICHGVWNPCNAAYCPYGDHQDETCPHHGVFVDGKMTHHVHKHYTKSGEERWFDITSSPLEYLDGKVSKMVQIVIDITEFVASFNTLMQSEKNFRKVVEKGHTLYCTIRIDSLDDSRTWTILSLNQKFAGRTIEQIGYTVHDLRRFQPEWSWKGLEESCRTVFSNIEKNVSMQILTIDPETKSRLEFWYTDYFPYYENEKISGIQIIGRNIMHERVETERLSELSHIEDSLYAVTHDLKSPLVSIKGYLDYLRKMIEENDRQGSLDIISRTKSVVERMELLISELLQLHQAEHTEEDARALDFFELVERALENLGGCISQCGAQIIVKSPLPSVYVDTGKMVAVLTNLIGNALKYAQVTPLKIEIGAKRMHDGIPVFYVKDNGVGIEKKYHEKIFKLFCKLTPEGNGIGLALVKKTITSHGGKVWVESEPDEGCIFCFTLGRERIINPASNFVI